MTGAAQQFSHFGNFFQDFFPYLVRESARFPGDDNRFTGISGNQMNMEMEDSLTGGLAIVLDDIDTVAAKHFCEAGRHFLCEHKRLGGKVFRQFMNIGMMRLRKDQGVAFCGRAGIQNHGEIIILIKFGGRDFSVRKFAEDTVLHNLILLVFNIHRWCQCHFIITCEETARLTYLDAFTDAFRLYNIIPLTKPATRPAMWAAFEMSVLTKPKYSENASMISIC